MNVAFITENGFNGKIPANFPNMRTEMAWIHALNADNYHIFQHEAVKGYDVVMVVFPKGGVNLNSEGIELVGRPNKFDTFYDMPFIINLKKHNKKVCFIQEGPAWYVNDFSVRDQFNFYNQLFECDILFCHNSYDVNWYQGWFPEKNVFPISTLIIEDLVKDIVPKPEEKAMIGGNFCRWYGGFQSYLVADEFKCPIYVPSMHNKRPGEDQVPNLHHLPYMQWIDWMKTLSTFKYAVHLMPTVAAGTFSLNCAYFGIPCIGNKNVDTQKTCHPRTSVEPEDTLNARKIAYELYSDKDFYESCSKECKDRYKHFSIDNWKDYMYKVLN
jgi:hypothetical protein